MMNTLRCAFDPSGLANPGKVFPTPRMCGEPRRRALVGSGQSGSRGGGVVTAETEILRALGDAGGTDAVRAAAPTTRSAA